MVQVYQQRINNARKLLKTNNLDALLVTAPQNFFYFSGTWLDSYERLQAIVIPQTDTPIMITHEMFKAQINVPQGMDKLFWQDGEDAIARLAKIIPACGTVAVDSQWPSGNLIHLMETNKQLTFATSTNILGVLRRNKDSVEIGLLKESGNCADQVMDDLTKFIRAGVTEREVVDEIKRLFKLHGAEQLSFDPIVAAGSNGAVPHHQPGDTVLKQGDAVVVDMGGVKDYYCSDMTRTFFLGPPTSEMETVYQVVRQAQDAAVQAIKPGVPMKNIDQTARNIIERAGYGCYFTHRTGHGLGIDIHEEPYLSSTNDQLLEEGMVVSVEPGIYLPEKFGVRIEDIVVVTKDGAERLNNYSRHIISI